jgi:hypothetical protein
MPSHTYKPNLKDLRNAAVLVESETRYTARGPKERKILREPSRSQSPRKRPQPSPSYQEAPELGETETMTGYPDMGFEPLKLPKTKVCRINLWKIVLNDRADPKRLSPGMAPRQIKAIPTKNYEKSRIFRDSNMQLLRWLWVMEVFGLYWASDILYPVL